MDCGSEAEDANGDGCTATRDAYFQLRQARVSGPAAVLESHAGTARELSTWGMTRWGASEIQCQARRRVAVHTHARNDGMCREL